MTMYEANSKLIKSGNVMIEDANRNEYLEALKEYREEKSFDKLIMLFEKEQQFYMEKCRCFM